jgi:hypothetical protein
MANLILYSMVLLYLKNREWTYMFCSILFVDVFFNFLKW